MTLSVVQVIGNVAVGGAERHVLDLVDGLRQRSVSMRVICPRPGPLVESLTQRGVAVHYLEMVRSRPGDEYGLDRAAVEQLIAWFREWRPDVVHSHLYPAHLHASLASVQVGVPAVVQTAHTLVVRPGDVLLGRLTHAVTIATSGAVVDLLVGAGLPRETIELIYNGVSADHFKLDRRAVERARAELDLGDGPVVGTVARLSHEKGVDALLRALPQVLLTVPSATAVIVGDGPEATPLKQLAADLGISRHVRFLGTRGDVSVLNYVFDAFVLPSREEACPMALLEAMAAGRPVVATRVGGSPELVDHGVDGLLVPPDNPTELARGILNLLVDASARNALGLAARDKVAAHFTRDRMVSATLACYRRILNVGGKAAPREAFRGRSA